MMMSGVKTVSQISKLAASSYFENLTTAIPPEIGHDNVWGIVSSAVFFRQPIFIWN